MRYRRCDLDRKSAGYGEQKPDTTLSAGCRDFRQGFKQPNQTVLTVIAEPTRNVRSPSACPERISSTAGPSPTIMMNGNRNNALSKLEYQLMDNALPSTTSNPRFITAACTADIKELVMPKRIPRPETCTLSRKIPTKKPKVTIEHDRRMRRLGRVRSKV